MTLFKSFKICHGILIKTKTRINQKEKEQKVNQFNINIWNIAWADEEVKEKPKFIKNTQNKPSNENNFNNNYNNNNNFNNNFNNNNSFNNNKSAYEKAYNDYNQKNNISNNPISKSDVYNNPNLYKNSNM